MIETIHAITKNTPLERVGKVYSKKDSVDEDEDEDESIEGGEYDEEIGIDGRNKIQ